MRRIGFVGLGMMGAPMAANLLEKGFQVTAQDVRREAVDGLVARGAGAAGGLEDLVGCDGVIVMVNTDAQAREVIEELISVLHQRPASILNMSTILPSTIRGFGEPAAHAGIGLLDVLPSRGNKLHAVEFLMQQCGFSSADTVFAGDSGNDLQVLSSAIPAVLVANASPEVRVAAEQQATALGHASQLYLAAGGLLGMNGNYSGGMLEGIAHYFDYVDAWLRDDRAEHRA